MRLREIGEYAEGNGPIVVSSAVASGRNARAAVHGNGSTEVGDGRRRSREEIRELVSRLIDGLGRSDPRDSRRRRPWRS
ncbi:hypothetical protein [Streptomyces roseus]|uniref:hypothetical protein n=1 Tax=Streptomyces roseus TaxID=66430 RepID=UPI00069F815E|nr:hypothetical protein [Streptomyces roseus]